MAKSKKIGSCLTCKHINQENVRKCKAFPDGIPTPIVMGGINHDKPFPGDKGIQYEPNDTVSD